MRENTTQTEKSSTATNVSIESDYTHFVSDQEQSEVSCKLYLGKRGLDYFVKSKESYTEDEHNAEEIATKDHIPDVDSLNALISGVHVKYYHIPKYSACIKLTTLIKNTFTNETKPHIVLTLEKLPSESARANDTSSGECSTVANKDTQVDQEMAQNIAEQTDKQTDKQTDAVTKLRASAFLQQQMQNNAIDNFTSVTNSEYINFNVKAPVSPNYNSTNASSLSSILESNLSNFSNTAPGPVSKLNRLEAGSNITSEFYQNNIAKIASGLFIAGLSIIFGIRFCLRKQETKTPLKDFHGTDTHDPDTIATKDAIGGIETPLGQNGHLSQNGFSMQKAIAQSDEAKVLVTRISEEVNSEQIAAIRSLASELMDYVGSDTQTHQMISEFLGDGWQDSPFHAFIASALKDIKPQVTEQIHILNSERLPAAEGLDIYYIFMDKYIRTLTTSEFLEISPKHHLDGLGLSSKIKDVKLFHLLLDYGLDIRVYDSQSSFIIENAVKHSLQALPYLLEEKKIEPNWPVLLASTTSYKTPSEYVVSQFLESKSFTHDLNVAGMKNTLTSINKTVKYIFKNVPNTGSQNIVQKLDSLIQIYRALEQHSDQTKNPLDQNEIIKLKIGLKRSLVKNQLSNGTANGTTKLLSHDAKQQTDPTDIDTSNQTSGRIENLLEILNSLVSDVSVSGTTSRGTTSVFSDLHIDEDSQNQELLLSGET
ncbi:MAG: hypothetical protein SFT93_03650 [Rickettsiaceae bacterium]|nr:hypothetical protein [Rickettsiaceae bacterium]